MNRNASCNCGQLTARVVGESTRVSICHCLACQRRTGSPFSAQARYPRESVTISGESSGYVRVGDEGPGARFHFCPHCGDTVYFEPLGLPGQIAIPVGAFADPEFPAPTVSVYEDRMHAWVVPPASIEHHQ